MKVLVCNLCWTRIKSKQENYKSGVLIGLFCQFHHPMWIHSTGYSVSQKRSSAEVHSSGVLVWHPDSGDMLGSIPAGADRTASSRRVHRDGFPSLTRHRKSSSHRLPDLISCHCTGWERHRWSPGLHGYMVTEVIGCRAPSLRCPLAPCSGCRSLFLGLPFKFPLMFDPAAQFHQ